MGVISKFPIKKYDFIFYDAEGNEILMLTREAKTLRIARKYALKKKEELNLSDSHIDEIEIRPHRNKEELWERILDDNVKKLNRKRYDRRKMNIKLNNE
jgi:hypothetical protein